MWTFPVVKDNRHRNKLRTKQKAAGLTATGIPQTPSLEFELMFVPPLLVISAILVVAIFVGWLHWWVSNPERRLNQRHDRAPRGSPQNGDASGKEETPRS
jgi:hypothetical protein